MKFSKLTPNLVVDDVSRSLEFYVNNLGFTQSMTVPETAPFVFGAVVKDGIELFFGKEVALPIFQGKPIGGTVYLYFEVENVDEFYGELKAKGVKIVSEPHTQFYGMREFMIADPDGWLLMFASRA